jgi:hypothetical protein
LQSPQRLAGRKGIVALKKIIPPAPFQGGVAPSAPLKNLEE